MESILRALSISLFLLSMERRSKEVFSVLQKNIILQSNQTLFLYCHVFPSSPKVKIYTTNQQVFLEKKQQKPNQTPKTPQNYQNHHQIQTNNQHQNTKLQQQQQQKTQQKNPNNPPQNPHTNKTKK